MNCSEFHEHAAGYALRTLSPELEAACAAHLSGQAGHLGCHARLAGYEQACAALCLVLPASVLSPRVWPRVDAQLHARRNPLRSPRLREVTAYALLAAAMVALAFVERGKEQVTRRLAARTEQVEQANVRTRDLTSRRLACEHTLHELERDRALARDAVALAGDARTRMVALPSLSPKFRGANALIEANGARVLIVATNVQASRDKDFELWTVRGKGAPEPAGFLRVLADGSAVGEIARERLLGGLPDAFAISLEPLGGRPVPTEVLALGKVSG